MDKKRRSILDCLATYHEYNVSVGGIVTIARRKVKAIINVHRRQGMLKELPLLPYFAT
jgi:hypothetical protein